MNTNGPIDSKRGEVWQINFDPTVGAEIQKSRPAVVLSSDSIRKLPLRIVAPVTSWQEHFSGNLWHVKLPKERRNGLDKDSAVDVLQVRGMDLKRFIRKRGVLTEHQMAEITAALALVIEHEA